MVSTQSTACLLAWSLLFSVTDAFAAVQSLTIRQAVDRALDSNPTVLNAREKLQESKSEHSAGISALFPQISANLGSERRKDSVLTGIAAFNGEPYNQYQADLQLVQPIYTGGDLWAGLSAANRQVDISELDLKIAERDTTIGVIQAYYAVLANQEMLASLKNNRKVEDEAVSVAKHREGIGRAQRLDVLQIKTDVANLDAQIAQTEADLKTSVSNLMYFFSDRTTTEIDLKGTLKAKKLHGLLDRLKDEPYEIYEFKRIEAQRDLTDDKNRVEMAKYWPQLKFIGNYGRISNTRADLFNDFANEWSYGLQLQIPIFSGLSSIAESNAHASQLKQIEIQEGQTKDSLAYAETKALHDLQAAEKIIEVSENALDIASQSVKEADRNFRLSTIDYLKYLDVQKSYLQSQKNYQFAELTYITATAKYLAATGHPVSELVKALE